MVELRPRPIGRQLERQSELLLQNRRQRSNDHNPPRRSVPQQSNRAARQANGPAAPADRRARALNTHTGHTEIGHTVDITKQHAENHANFSVLFCLRQFTRICFGRK